MKQTLTILMFLSLSTTAFARTEVGPEGHKLVWFLLAFVIGGFITFYWAGSQKTKSGFKTSFFSRPKVKVNLTKDRPVHPAFLELNVINTGNMDVDIDNPLLIFSGMWFSRKFRLKGTNNHQFYPLLLEKGQNHSLNIDLNRFYGFDKTLKRLPRVKVVVSDVNGKRLGSRKVLVRQTLFNV